MTKEQIIEACAQAAHEMNRIYCEAHGDMSQKAWKDASESIRNSSISGVGLALAGSTPEQQHEAWSKHKIADGWKYGSVKDEDKKTHPCLVPYNQLPVEQQLKDGLYISTVQSMAKALGY